MTAVAIGGSRRLPAGAAGRLLIRFLLNLPPDSTILLRQPAYEPTGGFETEVYRLVELLGLKVEWCVPKPLQPPQTYIGREGVFLRDVEMIAKCDLLLAFVTPEDLGGFEGGTEHLVAKALDQNRAAYAYTLLPDGRVTLYGSHDPENLWRERVPAA